jgi:hypothetical protein
MFISAQYRGIDLKDAKTEEGLQIIQKVIETV